MKNLFLTLCLTFMSLTIFGQNSIIVPKTISLNGISAICLNIPSDNFSVVHYNNSDARIELNVSGLSGTALTSNLQAGRYRPALTISNDTLWITYANTFKPIQGEILSWTLYVPSGVSVDRFVRPISEMKTMQLFVQ